MLDTQNLSSLSTVAELDLSREEDSVSSLASLTTREGLVAYTGIGSSTADKKKGKNEHFRTFSIDYPPRAKAKEEQAKGKISLLSKTCFFRSSNALDKQTYQALVKLSPVTDRTKPTKRIGAIATGLAPVGEIVILDATSASPNDKSMCARITLEKGLEPHDLDIATLADSKFAVAYCTDNGAYLYNLSYDFAKQKTKSDSEPTTLYTIPKVNTGKGIAPPPRLKWLSSTHLLLLINKNPGVELVVLHVGNKSGQPAQVILRKPLAKAITSAVSLAVCPLDADPASQERQLVIAVASGVSIHIYTLSHRPEYVDPKKQITDLVHFTALDDVHPVSITRCVFSNFFPPMQPSSSNLSVASSPQYIQLASVTLSGSVVVETLSLTSTPTSPSDTASADQSSTNDRKSHHPNVRWVLSTPATDFLHNWSGKLVIAGFVLLTAFLIRSYLDVTGQENVISDTWFRLTGSEPPFPLPRPAGGQVAPGQQVPGAEKIVLSPGGDNTASDVYRDAVEYAQDAASQVSSGAAQATDAATASVLEIRDAISSAAAAQSTAAAEGIATATQAVLLHLTDEHDDEHPEGEVSLAASQHDGEESVEQLKAGGAKEFHELGEADQEKWRRRLVRAGQWSRDEGETILKGILFSEYAGVVGGALRDAIVG